MIPKARADGSQTAFKVVVANGYDSDYAMYFGPTEWPDSDVASHGDKIPRELGEMIAREMFFLDYQHHHRTYRR